MKRSSLHVSKTITVLVLVSLLGIGSIGHNFDFDLLAGSLSGTESIPSLNFSTEQNNLFHGTKEVTLVIGGDIMMDRNIRVLGEKSGYDSLFTSITPLFTRADIAVANLEGPITAYPSKTIVNGVFSKELTFTFATGTAESIAASGIDIVSLANNHTDNFGMDGFVQTQYWLTHAGLKWFGNPWNATSSPDTSIATIVTQNGIKIAFVGYHQFSGGSDRVLAEIRRIATPDTYVVVMPHWGEEYVKHPSLHQKELARKFIQAGADAIIGAHPHVIMDHEWIGPVPVYYSLGNLLFDQYFSPEVMKGMVIELRITQDSDGVFSSYITEHEVALDRKVGVRLVPDSK